MKNNGLVHLPQVDEWEKEKQQKRRNYKPTMDHLEKKISIQMVLDFYFKFSIY